MDDRVVLLADAGPTTGAGHVMRSLTLAAAIQSAGTTAVLASCDLPVALRARADELGVEVADRSRPLSDPGVVAQVLATGAGAVVVDSYDVSARVMDELTARLPVLVIDDERTAPLSHPAAVLNQNLHADTTAYDDLDPGTHLLLGPKWALVRREVRERRDAVRRDPGTAFIALGGADVRNLTGRLADACAAAGTVPALATGLVGGRRQGAVDPTRFADALATSEVAVIGAGTTVWECLCLGTPAIALVTADNQLTIARSGLSAGVLHAAFDVRTEPPVDDIVSEVVHLAADPDRRRTLAEAGRALVDGQGAERVANVVAGLLS